KACRTCSNWNPATGCAACTQPLTENKEPVAPPPNHSALLEVRNLKVHFPVKPGLLSRVRAFVKAVEDVSFTIEPRETLGLVGEKRSGKTTLGRAIVRLIRPTAGQILFAGTDLSALEHAALRTHRRQLQMIFQDPYGSLNPRMTVEDLVGEAIDIHRLAKSQ